MTDLAIGSAPAAPPELTYVFSIVAEVAAGLTLEERSDEHLELIPITGGVVTGPRLSGVVLAGGGDWCLGRNDGTFRVEARYLVRTDGGDVVDVHNVGFLRHLDGADGDWTSMGYFMSTPVFRTAAPDLQWLTRTVFVGRAHADGDRTRIDVHAVGA